MQFDDTALDIAERKCARIGKLNYSVRTLHEVPAFLQWVWAQPTLRFYVRTIVAMHEAEDKEVVQAVDRAIDELQVRARELHALPFYAAQEIDPGLPHSWDAIERLGKNAKETADPHQRIDSSRVLAEAVSLRSKGGLIDASHAKRFAEVQADTEKVAGLAARHLYLLQQRAIGRKASPWTALMVLVDLCRALNPPVEGVTDWTSFFPTEHAFKAFVQAEDMDQDAAPYVHTAVQALNRFVEELRVLSSTTLSYRRLIGRFKERSVWYDKDRLRAVAGPDPKPGEKPAAGTEDRLTLELAKYLHDAGIFVLARPRMSNLEPDLVGLQGLAVEAKAYRKSGNARHDIRSAYYQLHAYMTALEAGAMPAREGFVVTFRLGGPIYTTPATIEFDRFVIHSMTVDLGIAEDSGRKQPETDEITEAEIFKMISSGRAPEPDDAPARTTRPPIQVSVTATPSEVTATPVEVSARSEADSESSEDPPSS